jgi:hypothetical protein
MSSKSYPVTVRIPLPDVEKLDRIAENTRRTRADVVRLLVGLAEETGVPDVRLALGKEKGRAA